MGFLTDMAGGLKDIGSGFSEASTGLWDSFGFDLGDPSKEDLDFGTQLGEIASSPMYEPDADAFKYKDYDVDRQMMEAKMADVNWRQAPTIEAAQMAMGPQSGVRRSQKDILAQLQRQEQGQGASQAPILAEIARGQGAQQGMAQAAAQRGGVGLRAALGAQEQGSVAGLSAAAAARAQETQAAGQAGRQLMGSARGQDIGVAKTQAGLQQQANMANQQAGLKQQSMNDQLSSYYAQQGFNVEQRQLDANMDLEAMRAEQVRAQLNAQASINAAARARDTDSEAASLGMIGGLVGLISDKNLKTNIESEDKNLDSFMNHLQSYSYEYKDEKHGKDRRFGIMAQDMEKSKVGKEIVMDMAEGKALDVNKTLSATLASIARLNKRLTKMEGSEHAI